MPSSFSRAAQTRPSKSLRVTRRYVRSRESGARLATLTQSAGWRTALRRSTRGGLRSLGPFLVVVGVDLGVLLPFVGQLVLGEAGVDWAGLDAGVAIDAFLGIDVQLRLVIESLLILGGMDAVHGTHLHTREVLGPDAG